MTTRVGIPNECKAGSCFTMIPVLSMYVQIIYLLILNDFSFLEPKGLSVLELTLHVSLDVGVRKFKCSKSGRKSIEKYI